MEVSENGGTSKSSTFMGFSMTETFINHPAIGVMWVNK